MASEGQRTPKITRDMLCVPVPDSAFEDVTQLFYVGTTHGDSASMASMTSLDAPYPAGHRTSRIDSVALEMETDPSDHDHEEDTHREQGVVPAGPTCKDAFVDVDDKGIDGDDDELFIQESPDGSTATIVVPIPPSSLEDATPGDGPVSVQRHKLEKLDSAKLFNRSRRQMSDDSLEAAAGTTKQEDPKHRCSNQARDSTQDRRGSEDTGSINWDQVVPESRVLSGVTREPLPCPSVSDQPPRNDSKKGAQGPALDRLQSTVSGTSTVFGSDEHTCRICWWGEERETCIQPCHCSGSSAYVHPSCLQKWLQVTNVYQCEICTFEFKTRKRTKPLSQWTWRVSKSRQVSQLEATLILLSIVTPPLVCGIVLCSQKISEYLANDEHAWKTAALMTLILASIITYLVAVAYFCRKVNLVCRAWMTLNQRLVVTLAHSNLEIEVQQMEPQPQVWTIT